MTWSGFSDGGRRPVYAGRVLCIELRRNGKRLATAGLPGKGVISVIFDRVFSDARGPKELLHFRLGGLDSSSSEPSSHLEWAGGDVEVGDEFTVRFLHGESSDPPVSVEPPLPRTKAAVRRRKVAWLRVLEKQVQDLRKELAGPRRKTQARRSRRRS